MAMPTISTTEGLWPISSVSNAVSRYTTSSAASGPWSPTRPMLAKTTVSARPVFSIAMPSGRIAPSRTMIFQSIDW